MKHFLRSFRQLRWKLTLSYTLTSVAGFLLVLTIIIGGGLLLIGLHPSNEILGSLGTQAAQAAPYLEQATNDPEPLTAWLQITSANDTQQGPFNLHPIFLTATNIQGKIMASAGSQPLIPGTSLQAQLSPQSRASLNTVLNDARGQTNGFVQEASTNTLVAIVPIRDSAGQVQGALVLKADQPQGRLLFSYFFDVLFFGGTFALVLTTIFGLVFGYLIARGLTRRLKRLSRTADRWSQGDFSAQAADKSQDELGQMARQFNQMAAQLQNLLEARQQLATLEERNRLARDLHDSVKQQIFAISMQIASTRILLKRDVEAAGERLNKTEKLVQQAQQELTSLIRELRPVALEGKGLEAALRELLPQWSQQSEIVANLRVEGTQALPLTVEEALFRVAQEALSNIARHSKATLVQFTLSMNAEEIALEIRDNGQGFDSAHLEHRGVGLFSMQERMKALGGDARVESKPGQGTRVVAHCPRLGVTQDETTIEPAKSV